MVSDISFSYLLYFSFYIFLSILDIDTLGRFLAELATLQVIYASFCNVICLVTGYHLHVFYASSRTLANHINSNNARLRILRQPVALRRVFLLR